VVSPAYLHPEFGWFCPSLSLRRKARVALVFLAFLVAVGALALKASHDPNKDGTPMTARGDAARFNAETVETVGLAATSTAESSRPLEGSRAACEGGTRYIDGRCSMGGKLRGPRAANEAAMIAALPLGRSTLPTSSAAPLDPIDAANTVVPTPELADPPSSPAPKKARKALRSQNSKHDLWRDGNWRDDRWRARPWGPSW
jgi:hypothetical protein